MTPAKLRKARDLVEKLHMITDPGEYGLGSEPESYNVVAEPAPDADYVEVEAYLEENKLAWEQVGKLVEELMQLLD
jgi:hypothetical protein